MDALRALARRDKVHSSPWPPRRRNGTIVNADATTLADVLVDGEAIALIGTDLAVTADRRPLLG
jgi:hypothetical protein